MTIDFHVVTRSKNGEPVPKLHVSQSHITTDGQSVIMSRYRVHSGACDQILLSVFLCLVIFHYLHQLFTLHVSHSSAIYIQ
jgi:hypothetical protein